MEKALCEIIDEARHGRTQTWIVRQMILQGCDINDVKFTRKKYSQDKFTEKEATILSKLLKIKKDVLLQNDK